MLSLVKDVDEAGGIITRKDLEEYQVEWRTPMKARVSRSYRAVARIGTNSYNNLKYIRHHAAHFFVRIPDRYYRVVCRYQDGVRRAKPLVRRGNSQLNHNSPVYYRVSGFPIRDVLIERLCHRLKPLQPRVNEEIGLCLTEGGLGFTSHEEASEGSLITS